MATSRSDVGERSATMTSQNVKEREQDLSPPRVVASALTAEHDSSTAGDRARLYGACPPPTADSCTGSITIYPPPPPQQQQQQQSLYHHARWLSHVPPPPPTSYIADQQTRRS